MDAALADADGMVLRGWGPQGIGFLSAERLARARRLRYIGSTCHYAQAKFIDVDAAVAQGIAMSETAPVMSPWVAEYEMALVLAALRSLPQEHEAVGANGWVRWIDHPEWAEVPDRLHGRRVGLAGFGEIHRHLARMLAPFDTDSATRPAGTSPANRCATPCARRWSLSSPIPPAPADQRPRGVGGLCQAQPGSSAAQRSYTGSACPASVLRVRYHNADQVS